MTNILTVVKHVDTDSIESMETEEIRSEAQSNGAATIQNDIANLFGIDARQADNAADDIGAAIASGESGMARHYALEFAMARVDSTSESRERRYKRVRDAKNANLPYERAKPFNEASWKKQLDKVGVVAAVGVKFEPTAQRFAAMWTLALNTKRVDGGSRSVQDLFLTVCRSIVDKLKPEQAEALDSLPTLAQAMGLEKYADSATPDSAESSAKSTKSDVEILEALVKRLDKVNKSAKSAKLTQASLLISAECVAIKQATVDTQLKQAA